MEACTVLRIKRVGNLRATFQEEVHLSASPVLNRAATAAVIGNVEHEIENVSFGATYARPYLRQDSFIISEHHFTKLPPSGRSESPQRCQVDQSLHLSSEVDGRLSFPVEEEANTIHGITFSFSDAGLGMALPQARIESDRVSCISIQFHNGVAYQHDYYRRTYERGPFAAANVITQPQRPPYLLNTSFDGEEYMKDLVTKLNNSPDRPDWTWKPAQIDRTPPL